ncbi:PQQ-binding-like beta-propeller repeat protein [Candidatus Bathyarchaeota archaeon]|nr:PQQ-binding-like beta-propeller repeat protein [Candidatus Bathyarchaeota archaeon]
MKLKVEEIWRLKVGVGPAEHGVYKNGYLYLAPTFRDEFWKVDPEKGVILKAFKMPSHVWGAPWVDETSLYGASIGGHIVKFSLDGEVLWKSNPSLGDFTSEAVTEAWGGCLAVQFPKGLAVLDKSGGKILWCDEWSPEAAASQEPTFDPEASLLWVCRPTAKGGLVAYDLNGRKIHSSDLPTPPTSYACPQIWTRYVLAICRRHVAVFDRCSGRRVWSRDFSTVTYGGETVDSLAGGPRVVTYDGRVIVWTADGVFMCLSMENGDVLWTLDFKRLGYASAECNDPWGYAGGAAVDGVFIILGRNNLPESSGSPFAIGRNRLFIIDYKTGKFIYVSEPIHQMACCCKPIIANGKVIIGSWYKDSERQTYNNLYSCWRIRFTDEPRKVLDRDYPWLGGLHHGGYSRGCLLGLKPLR